MDLLFTREQTAMVEAVSKYLATAVPLERLHTGERPGQELVSLATEDFWTGLAELGLFGLGVPEELGGAGLGVADEIAVFREVGRHVSPGPLLGTVLAAHAAASEGRTELVEALLEGRERVALAAPQPGKAARVGPRVSGTFRFHDLETASWALVLAGNSGALVSTSAVETDAVDAIDPTAPVSVGDLDVLAEFTLADASAVVVRGSLLLASMLCGLSEAARDDSATYVKTRQQFGKPIGAFQGVKHRCAEMAVRSEAAFFQTVYGALVVDEGHDQPEFHAAAAVIVARQAAEQNTADNIQNHGGMGFTAEADAHLFARRQLSLRFTLGGDREHLETIAREERMP